ncbi:MAG: IS66 family insertion sequence element accessory protein TnpA [Candidatus Rokuibacteriota bacterium]
MAPAKTHRVSVPTPLRPRPRRAHWQALIAACRRSGLSQAEFCRRRGLRPGTLAFWKHTLTRAVGAARRRRPAAPAFVPVRVVPPSVPPPIVGVATAPSGEIDIVLSRDRHVRVRGLVDVAWLGQVVRTLETLGC